MQVEKVKLIHPGVCAFFFSHANCATEGIPILVRHSWFSKDAALCPLTSTTIRLMFVVFINMVLDRLP